MPASGSFRFGWPLRLVLGWWLGTAASTAVGQTYAYTFNSDPAGLIAQAGTAAAGASVSSPLAAERTGGYAFGYWTLNGMRQATSDGTSPLAITFPLNVSSIATAVYFPLAQDADHDGVPDWFEWRYFGGLSLGGSAYNPDGDDFGAQVEASRRYSPVLVDTVADGGIASRRSARLAFVAAGSLSYTITSSPVGILNLSGTVTSGTAVSTPTAPEQSGGNTFGYWTVNGVRQAEANGAALSAVTFTVAGPTTVIAVYFPTTADTDADGITDWFEWRQFGSLGLSGSYDADGDGFDTAVEAHRRYSPVLVDAISDGGIASRRSTKLAFAGSADLAYTIVSSPSGILAQSGAAPAGTTITTPFAPDQSGAYVFGYWSINGTRHDPGAASHVISFTLAGTTTVTATYFPATEDTDGDGVPDWFEWRQFGGVTQGGGSFDPDGDGFDAATEARRGYSPSLADLVLDGGIASRRSARLAFAATGTPTGFDNWATSHFTPAELADPTQSGPNAIYGEDGLPNLIKYALGLDPKVNATSGLPEVSATVSHWTYTYTRPGNRLGLTYAVEVSTNLSDWSTVGVTLSLVSTAGGLETWQATYPLTSADTLFFRLRITQ